MTNETKPRWPYYALAEAEWQDAAGPEHLPAAPGVYAIFCPGCKQKPAVTVVAGKSLREESLKSSEAWERAKLTSPFSRLRFKTLEADPDLPFLQTELDRYRDKLLKAFEEFYVETPTEELNDGNDATTCN